MSQNNGPLNLRVARIESVPPEDKRFALVSPKGAHLPQIYGIRGLIRSTLFGLIATTNLRTSEALSLDCGTLATSTLDSTNAELGLLKADKRAIFRASGHARSASEYVLNLEQQLKQAVLDDSLCMNEGA